MPGLLKTAELIATPLGSFVYYLLVLLSVEAALGMALGEWQHAHDERGRRLLLATLFLTLVRVLYVVVALLARSGSVLPATWLAPLERFTDAACICLLGWAFAPPGRRGLRQGSWALVFEANLILAVLVGAGLTIAWGRAVTSNPNLSFSYSWEATVWSAWQMVLAALAAFVAVRSLRWHASTLAIALSIVFLGALLQMLVPGAATTFPVWERLANLVAYPLVAVGFYQTILVGMRDQLRQLKEISQASLDQIRSLLVLSGAVRQLSVTLDPTTILNNAVQGLARALQADECAVALPDDEESGCMRLVAIHNPARQSRAEGGTFPLEYQLAIQQAMRRKKYVAVEDLENVQLRVLFALLGSAESGPLLVQPLLLNGDAIGAIIVGNSRSRRAFTANEAKLCQSMAEQVVIALHNAQRYKAAQDRIRELHRSQDDRRRALQPPKAQAWEYTEQLVNTEADIDEPGESGGPPYSGYGGS